MIKWKNELIKLVKSDLFILCVVAFVIVLGAQFMKSHVGRSMASAPNSITISGPDFAPF